MKDPKKDYIGLAEPYSKDFGALVQSKIDAFTTWFSANGLKRQCEQNFNMYHNADPNGGATFSPMAFEIVGENGELVSVRVNSMRNLLTHLLNLIVAQPPALLAKARNADPLTIEATQDFDAVLEHYMQTWERGRIKKLTRKAAEQCTFLPFGAVLVEWDTQAGPVHVNDELGRPVHQGDLSMQLLSVMDVITDPGVDDEGKLEWVLCRTRENRYEYAARFPDAYDKIMGLDSTEDADQEVAWGHCDATDQIYVWKFFHKPTMAVPDGRMAISLDPETIVYDGPNPYGQLPVFFIRASEGHGSIYGYPPANDIAPLNVAENMMFSALTTNYAMFGVSNIAVKAGDEPAVNAINGGMRILEYTDVAPQALNLAQNAAGSFDFLGLLRSTQELVSGINSAQRGDPDANVKTAKQQGMLQALAVQYANGMQASYSQLLEDIGNFLLKLFQIFATTDRVTSLIGKDRIARRLTWTGASWGDIDSVVVEQVDPAMRTLGYRTDQAAFLTDRGLITDPVGYMTVMTTGNLNTLIEPELQEDSLIRQENSKMLRGQDTQALVTDDHAKHIKRHKMLLDSENVRASEPLLAVVLAHQQQHLDMQKALQMQAQGMGGEAPADTAGEMESAQPSEAAPPPQVEQTQQPV